MFKNNISKQAIKIDCDFAPSTEIGKDISISGKTYYAPVFENEDIKSIRLYFRAKYKKTKAAVSKDKIPFDAYLVESRFGSGSVVDLTNLVDHSIYTHITSAENYNEYILYFATTKDQETYEGYLVFVAPKFKEYKVKFSKTELKLIKYIKSILDI